MVKDFIAIRDCWTLDQLIERLLAARAGLPVPERATVSLTGDDFFGRALTITYWRPQTPEEAACEARYEDAYLGSLVRKLADLQAEVSECRGGGAPSSIKIAA